MTRSIDDISDQFVRDAVALSPLLAVYLGMHSDGALDDLSPAGLEARHALESATLADANAAAADTEA